MPPERGALSSYGFQVQSQSPLRFLRSGGGVETLEVAEAPEPRAQPKGPPLADWPLVGAAPGTRAALYRMDCGYEFWASDIGGYRIDLENGRIEIPHSGDEILREQRLWGVPSILSFMRRGDLPLHSAAVEINAGAVLLAAPPRFGKTTLALAFHQQGYRVLSEDIACCRLSPTLQLLPGPALLRIRPDVYHGQAPPGTHVVASRPDRVFLGLDDDRKGGCAPVPIAGIVFLRESAGDVRMEAAQGTVALADLWALNFRLQTDEGRAQSFQQLTRLAGALPVWNLYRPLRQDTLEATVARIVEHFDRP